MCGGGFCSIRTVLFSCTTLRQQCPFLRICEKTIAHLFLAIATVHCWPITEWAPCLQASTDYKGKQYTQFFGRKATTRAVCDQHWGIGSSASRKLNATHPVLPLFISVAAESSIQCGWFWKPPGHTTLPRFLYTYGKGWAWRPLSCARPWLFHNRPVQGGSFTILGE